MTAIPSAAAATRPPGATYRAVCANSTHRYTHRGSAFVGRLRHGSRAAGVPQPRQHGRTPLPSAAAAGAAAVTAAAAAAAPTFFSQAAWMQWTAASLGAYVLYWAAGLMRYMPLGLPVSDVQAKETASPGMRRLLAAVVLGALLTIFVLPWLAMWASGSWSAGLTYFLPSMVMTVVNITLEKRARMANRTLAVYASTSANNLWRLGASVAALWDMSLLAATVAAAPHLALQLMAAWQATFAVIVMLVLTPAAIARLPVRSTAEM